MDLMLSLALKEWAVAVEALEAGETILLLRKGGIREGKGGFKVEQNRVLLYPTFEHQKPDLLKSEYCKKVVSVESGWHPETVRIGSFAEITDAFLVAHEPAIKALLPYHIWNEQFITERLKWKPSEPVSVLLLRVYKLAETRIIPYRQEYGGCKSWMDIKELVSLENSVAILSDGEYNKQANAIRQTIANPV
ncbi:DUF1802 family protein [Ancylothrix sp. C2]|uniref:DUF1802 family protein n=1 Tax=Ancylothrix sp. D3o TaxID=2953691 RepID=UPI0021BAD99B|nr:DUF1802 family protein [Ancylothrix sp. D3o]MCT7951434.1 DUF1802 family protein [Ancylothrix sp. D3o]